MKGIRKAAGLAALAILPYAPARAQGPTTFIRNLEAGKPQVMVAFGTSLTALGAWTQLTRTWLQGKYPGLAAVYNEGASGHSSKYGLSIIHNVTRHKPDLVLIEFAMNDAYYPARDGYTEGVPVDTSKINLGIIVDSIKAVNPACEIFVQTMDEPLGIHRVRRPNILAYYQGYRDLAKAKGWGFIDHLPHWQALLAFDTSAYLAWVPDSIHPNAAASAAMTLPAVLGALTGAAVSLDSPGAGQYPAGTLSVKATVNGFPGDSVAFFDLSSRVGSAAAPPFAFAWKPAVGRHLLMAKVMDGGTPIAIAAPAAITIKPPTGLNGGAGERPGRSNARATLGKGPRPPGFWLGRRSAPYR